MSSPNKRTREELESPQKRRKIQEVEDEELDLSQFINESEDSFWNFKEDETHSEWVERVMDSAEVIGKKFMFGQVQYITSFYIL
jgi:hypothetical protein